MCFESMYERLFTNESVCCRFEVVSEYNTSQIFKRMVGLVEMNSHRETPAVVSDALFMIIQSKSALNVIAATSQLFSYKY